jgi:hypothetical protein
MDHQDKAIRRFRLHIATRLFLKYAVPLATAWGFAWGIAVLTLRAAVGVERLPLLWGLLGLAVCAALAGIRTRRRMPAASAIRALLDEQSGCGGLLMAGAEQELGGWRQRLPALRLPRIQWDGRRSATLLAVADGFVLLTFLAPQGLADLTSNSPLDVDREITRLVEQVALLKGESILDPERAEMLKEKLAEVREQSSGKEPARTLEALDHLCNLTGEAARSAAEDRTRRSEHLSEAEALADVLSKSADMLSPRMKMEVMAELAGLMDKGGLDLKQLAESIGPDLVKAMRDKRIDSEQLKKLASTLQGNKIDLEKQVEKLHKAGLIDAELLAKCQRAGDCDSEHLRAFLQKHRGEGGISRGPGAAPMTWGKPGSEEGFKFKEEVLPPGALASLKSSPTNIPGGRAGQIVHHKTGALAESGALSGAKAGSGSATSDVILPRHRAAVERYFQR